MWSDFAAWIASPEGQRVLSTTVLPALAILVAGLIAGVLARAAIRRVERRLDQDALTAAVAGFVEAARRTASGEPDRDSTARLASVSDVRMRLVGRAGADLAAQWAYAISLHAAPDDVAVVRDRLVAWTARPARAKRLFAADLEALATPAAAPAERAPRPEPTATPTEPPQRSQPVVEQSAPPTGGVPVERPLRVPEPEPAAAVPAEPARQPIAEPAPAQPLALVDVPAAQPAAQTEGPAARAAAGAPGRTEGDEDKPAWLDAYDDDAHVTRNIPLSTPSPVAAASVRDRSRPGDNIVPS